MIASFRARRLPSRAALLLEAAALCVCSTTTMAAVVDSPIDNLSLPNTFIGLYINVVSGAAGTSAAAGWDFNAFTNGTNLIFDWNNAPAGSAGGVANASPTGTFVGLAPGATVSAASLFATNTSATTGSPFLTTQNGYLGIRFRNEATGQVNYGYLRLTTTASSGFPATILCARYENTGAAITVATCGATADMSASLTDSPDPVAAIGTITYTATATNNGPATATNVTITLPVPVGTSFFPASPSAGGSCNAASPVVCTFTGPTAVGAANARSVVINAAVQSNTAPGTVINATASTSSPTFEPNSANNAAATTTTVGNPASLCSIATPATLPSGVPGTAYSAAITAGGGTAPYVFSKIGTGVPGLTLSSAGVLSGTPTFAGSYVFTVRAVDGANCPAARVYTVSIVSAHQCAVPTFNRLDIASANAPNAAAAGDFNDDGRSDLVVANSGNSTISVMLADGVGGFTSTTLPFAAATQQNHTLATGDLDRNGQLDFVAALGSSVRVFIGNGSGGFSAPADYPASGSLIGVKLADFNADGNLDVTGHTFSGTVVPVLLGNGDGTLRPFTFSLATAAVSAVEVADFNGDGRLDLAAAQPTTNGVGIFLGNGNGTFQNRTSYAFGAQPVDLSTGDWNLDGRVDLACFG